MAGTGRSFAATLGLLLVGGLAGCGGSSGPPLTVPPTTSSAATTAPAVVPQTGGGNCSRTSVGFTPLSDLGRGRYHGQEGGLYPAGGTAPPRSYLNAGLAAARQVRPLAPDGAPSPSGRIVLLSIGMSNASLGFRGFLRAAAADSALTPGALGKPGPTASLSLEHRRLKLVNGAVSSFDAERIVMHQAAYFANVDADLSRSDVTADQVQAVWLYEAIANESKAFPADAKHLEGDLNTIIAMLTAKFPNLRLVYVSSREYGGYALTTLNPEPYAYDSGFAVKWTVASRVADSGRRPWVAWGPYTWADGTHPRSDGLAWNCSDFAPDGTHPSGHGTQKLGGMLLKFFTTDPTARTWFDSSR